MNITSQYTEISIQQRVVGAYLGLAIGDALGASTEFLTPGEIQAKDGTHRDICGGGWLNLKPGQVTDDTEMSLALGQSIIDHRGVKAEAVAEAFSDWMRSKPIDIGNTVRRGIIHFRTTGEPSVAENEHDAGNGACMRCLPIAIFHCHSDTELLIQDSAIQSHTTHNNHDADAGTETVLQMLVAAFHGLPKSALQKYTNLLVLLYKQFCYDGKKVENPSGWIIETLQVVFQAFFEHDSFEDILVDVVNRGGDADTTGAIAGMLAGAYYGPDAIPQQWIKTLDGTVKKRCEDQALELLSLATK